MSSSLDQDLSPLRSRLPDLWRGLAAELPFYLLNLGFGLAAVGWGLHETDKYLVRTGLDRQWAAYLTAPHVALTVHELLPLIGRTLWGLLVSFVLPAISIIGFTVAIALRLVGAVAPAVRPRTAKGSWLAAGLGVLFLLVDMFN